jgi:hypothetical protein
MHRLLILLFLLPVPVLADEAPKLPTAQQMIANHIGELTIQNATMAEQISVLKAQIDDLKKQLDAKSGR